MIEILRLQIAQILGGKRRYLVLVALALPVLLSLAVKSQGLFPALEDRSAREQEIQALVAGEIPSGYRHPEVEEYAAVLSTVGVSVGGGSIRMGDQRLSNDAILVSSDAQFVLRGDGLWLGPEFDPEESLEDLRLEGSEFGSGNDLLQVADPLRLVQAIYLFFLYPQVLCLLLALLYGTSILGQELDGKTLTYLFVRPLPRWRFVVGKFLGIVAALALPTALSALASWALITGFADVPLLLAILASTFAALCAYNAVFGLIGFIAPQRAMIIALLYGIAFEFVLSFVPALINQATVTYYLRSLVVDLLALDLPPDLGRILGGAGLPTVLLALGLLTSIPLLLASLLASHREYKVKDEA